ncbi:MAG: hypothetical protein WCH11_01300 [Bdellovibrio sp.]
MNFLAFERALGSIFIRVRLLLWLFALSWTWVFFGAASSASDSTSLFVAETPTISLGKVSDSGMGRSWLLSSRLSFESARYASPWPENSRLQQSQRVTAEFQGKWFRGAWEHELDFFAGGIVDWGVSHFGWQSLGSQWRQQNQTWSFGRHIRNWSWLDREWELGLWEPKFALDSLRPVRQGLTGIFYERSSSQQSFLLFVTPVFIPTMGPEIREKNQGLVAESRWYRAPSSSLNLFGKEIRVLYSLDEVNIANLVTNPGAGFRWSVQPHENWELAVNYAQKPINQLSVRYRRDLITRAPDNPDGQAVVGPALSLHELGGSDFFWHTGAWKVYASYLEDRPKKQRAPGDQSSGRIEWIQQQPGEMKIWGAGVVWQNVDRQLRVSYLNAQEELSEDVDSMGVVRGAIFPHRLQYTRALRVSWSEQWNSRFSHQFSWLREEDQKGDIVMTLIRYQNPRPWIWSLGFDVLSLDDSSSSNSDDRFINQFRLNDRIFGGISYVF